MEHDVYVRMAEIQDRHWWYEARRQILASLIKNLPLKSSPDIMEAGCGPGANLGMLSDFGVVHAFEPDSFALKYCHDKSGISEERLKQGFLPAPIPFDKSFDLIGAFDVIEHVEEDAASLKALFEKTKPGGYALFTVPAYMFLWSQHDVVNHHKRRYTKKQFESLLSGSGFQVDVISYYNMFLFPLVAGIRFLKKALKIKDKPDETLPRLAIINKILFLIFSCEKFLIGKIPLPFGVSILAVCRRPAGNE